MIGLLITGCTSPEQKLQATTASVRSWESTLRMTSEALADRKIPRGYAYQVLQAAWEHERSIRRRPEWQSLPSDLKQHFARAADQLASRLGTPPENADP